MNYKGIYYEILNEYGNYLAEVLEDLPLDDYLWSITRGEIHLLDENGVTGRFLFEDADKFLQGSTLYSMAKNNTYYMVFATIGAYRKSEELEYIRTYNDFLQSECQIIVIVADCSEVIIICKDERLVLDIYNRVKFKECEKVKLIDEKDLISNIYILD